MRILHLQVDVTNYCNSHCGGCIRNIEGGSVCVELVHLPVSVFKKIDFTDIQSIHFNGAYGDMSMHPEMISIVDSIPRNVVFDASTNGGARTSDWWKQLANKTNEFDKSQVSFAIDGLETNHYYRRGVSIDSVLSNAEAFLSAGGQAKWKYIAFEHNEHEIEKASVLAKEMGFSEFCVLESYKPEIFQMKYKTFPEFIVKHISPPTEFNWKKDEDGIHYDITELNLGYRCLWRNRASGQLDAWGNIWQCCYMPSIATHPEIYKELNLFQLNNNLHKYDYNEILNSDFFTELFDEPLELCKSCKEYV